MKKIVAMHYADIIAALKKADSSVSQIAVDLGVTLPTVSTVIHGKCTSRRVAARISQVTGIPMTRLWPGRYPDMAPSVPQQAA